MRRVGDSDSGVPLYFGHRFWLKDVLRLERRCGVEVMHLYWFMDSVFKNLDPLPVEVVYDCQVEKRI